MALSIIGSDATQGEVFLPGQIFVFGGFALRANSLGHLEQIESYAPGHQVRFRNLNYTADIRGDLIFDGFEPMSAAPHDHDEHDLALPSDSVRKITPATTPALNPEQIAPSEDGGIDPTMEAALSVAIEPDTDFTPYKSRVAEPLDSSPANWLLAACNRTYRTRLGADHGVHLRGYLSALTFWRCAKFIKVSLLVRRTLAELCPARMGCG